MPLFKIKSEHKDLWVAWSALLQNQLHDTAIETLKEEGLVKEVSELIEINGEYYDHGWFVGIPKPATERPINVIHRHLKHLCLEKMEGAVLYDLEVPRHNTSVSD